MKGIKYEDNFREQVQTGWEQSQMGSQQTYARNKHQRQPNIYRHENISVSSSVAATLGIHNGNNNGAYPSTTATTQGQNYWGMHEQMTKHTFLQTEQHNSWQQEDIQKSNHNVYLELQGIHSYGHGDEEHNAQNSNIQYAMPTFLNPTPEVSGVNNLQRTQQGYGYHPRINSPATTTAKTQSNEHFKPIVDNKERYDDAPVRGDLGTGQIQPEDTILPTSTMKYISADDYEKYLQNIVETIKIHIANQNASRAMPSYSTHLSTPKQKTPEQIESLSSMLQNTTSKSKITPITNNIDRATNTYIENIEQKADTVPTSEYDFDGQVVESFNTKFDEQERDSFFDQQPEIFAQELEKNNRQIIDKHHNFEGPSLNYNPTTNKIEYQSEITDRQKYLSGINTDLNKVSLEPSQVNPVVSKDKLQTTTISTAKQAHAEPGHQYVVTQESQKQMKWEGQSEESTDFGQQSESSVNWDQLGQFTLEQQPEDFGLMKKADQNKDIAEQEDKSVKEPDTKGKSFDYAPEIEAESMAKKHISELNQNPANTEDRIIGLEEMKEFKRNPTDDDSSDKSGKHGFWKNVGTKITKAKDTVACWFSEC